MMLQRNPGDLFSSLLDSQVQLTGFTTSAITAHKRAGVGPREINEDGARGILFRSFTYATRMMHFEPDILDLFLGLHRIAYVSGPRTMDPEGRLRNLMNLELTDRGLERISFMIEGLDANPLETPQ